MWFAVFVILEDSAVNSKGKIAPISTLDMFKYSLEQLFVLYF